MSVKPILLTKIIDNRDFVVEYPKNICYCYSKWQESYGKIKNNAPDIKLTCSILLNQTRGQLLMI